MHSLHLFRLDIINNNIGVYRIIYFGFSFFGHSLHDNVQNSYTNRNQSVSLVFFFSFQNVYLLMKFPLLTDLFSNFSGDFLLFGRLLFCHFAMISFMLIHAMVFTIVNYHSNVLLAILICLSAKKSNCCCQKRKKTVECLSSRNDIVVIGFV